MTASIQSFVDAIAAKASVDPAVAKPRLEQSCLSSNRRAMRQR